MKKGKIYIGTSGWSYKDWKEVYYPKGIKPTDWISFYAQDFKITEINTSFYHLPKHETIIKWVDKVPGDFMFCPKMSRYITHLKKLHDPVEPLQRFFDVFAPMKEQMGPILVQLPPQVIFNTAIAQHFFSILENDYKDYRFALEIRNNTWLEEEPLDMLRKHKISFVISQSGVGWPYEEIITAKDIYVRFHGPGKLYASKYNDKDLQHYADKFEKWLAAGHNVWVFFNNDWYTYAIQNAKTLMQMMGIDKATA